MLLMTISNIMGREELVPYLVYTVHDLNVDAVVFNGNTLSPLIIEEVKNKANTKVLGITGNLDDVSVIKTLKDHGGFLEGKISRFKGIVIAGIGASIDSSINNLHRLGIQPHILFTFYPPRIEEYGLGIGKIREIIEDLDPNIIIVGRRAELYRVGNTYFSGNSFRGDSLLISFRNNSYIIKPFNFIEYF